MPYRPSLASRIRAFFFTDRVGHTLASIIGFFALLRWWIARRISRSS